MTLENIAAFIKEKDNILLLPHVSADGDSIGSSTGLAAALMKLGKKVTVVLEEEPPLVFKYLSNYEILQVYNASFKGSYDCVIALDTGDEKRLGQRIALFNSCALTVNIDHHQTNTNFAKYNYVDINASAVAEIMWDLIKLLNVEMDVNIGTCLYTSIMTDTGGFRFSNTTAKTHRIAGEMIELGVEIDKIASFVFESNSVARLKLIGYVLNSLELYFNDKIAMLTITEDMLQKANATEDDSEGLVNYAKGILGVEVGILLKETPKGTRVNLRSKDYVDVAAIAASLGGGGHKKAAGATVEASLNEVKDKVLDIFKKEFMN